MVKKRTYFFQKYNTHDTYPRTLSGVSVSVTVRCPSVRPPVCLSRRSTAATTCGGFAAAERAGDIDRDIRRRRRSAANAVSVKLTADVRGYYYYECRAVVRMSYGLLRRGLCAAMSVRQRRRL